MKDLLDRFRLGHNEFENGRLDGIEGINPFDLFELWMTEAVETEEREANAFVLSTIDEANKPSSRTVYLKDIIENQFVLYTVNNQWVEGATLDGSAFVTMATDQTISGNKTFSTMLRFPRHHLLLQTQLRKAT